MKSMQPGVAIAIVLSAILIGIAGWVRHSNSNDVLQSGELIAANDPMIEDWYYQDILNDFLSPSATGTAQEYKPLTGTDVVSRQLLLDYIGLAGSGQASPQQLEALAQQYVESIPTLSASERVDISSLNQVSNSKANFQDYANALTQIHNDYVRSIFATYPKEEIEELNPGLYSSISGFSTAYRNAAEALVKIPVPKSVSGHHLDLINLFLSSASAAENITKSETDPTSAFAGVVRLSENSKKEKELLEEISLIISNGI